jgi:cysteine synthase A
LIEDAEEKGLITPGTTTLLGVTSGNLGIGVAFIAAQKGYKFIAVMPAKLSLDKQILLRYLGAEVVLVGKKLMTYTSYQMSDGNTLVSCRSCTTWIQSVT